MIHGEVNVQRCRASWGEHEIWVNCLRINGRPLPVEVSEMIPEEDLAGEPLGWIERHGGGCCALFDHLHLLWINTEGEMRTTTVEWEPRWKDLPQLLVGD